MPRKPKTPPAGKAKGALPRAPKKPPAWVKAAADRAEGKPSPEPILDKEDREAKKARKAAKRAEMKAEAAAEPPITPLAEEAKHRTGRPSSFTEAVAAEICAHIIEGHSLRSYCAQPGKPAIGTVYRWIGAYATFKEQYVRAREEQADTYADEIVRISDEEPDPQKARVRIDARKWVASKLKPKVYSDYTRVDQSVTLTEEQVDARLGQLMSKANGVADVVHH